jgi:hypothetical protein
VEGIFRPRFGSTVLPQDRPRRLPRSGKSVALGTVIVRDVLFLPTPAAARRCAIFGLVLAELRRIPIPRTPVNRRDHDRV